MKKTVNKPAKTFALLLAVPALLVVFAQNAAPTVLGTITTLEEGLTNVPLEAAVANIEGWQSTLGASNETALQNLGVQLGELSAALQAEPIDGEEVSRLLVTLGEGTSAVAAGDEELARLGTLLSEAGGSLMGGGMTGGMSGGMTGGMSGGGM